MMRKLEEIEFDSFGVETEASISNLEALIGVAIPPHFRSHLLQYGGGYTTDCLIDCKEPSPILTLSVVEIASVEGILRTIESDIVPRNLLCIGNGHGGQWTCISIAGVDHGRIYAFDSDMRFYWGPEELENLPDLDPAIKNFFRLRDEDELPTRPWGYENCYEVADNYEEFLAGLRTME